MTKQWLLSALAALALPTVPSAAADVAWTLDAAPRRLPWAADDNVHVFQAHEGILYVGGRFDHLGRPTGSLGRFDAGTGEVDLSLPPTDGEVLAIASDGQGGWIVGGEFTRIGAAERTGLARFDASWALTDWAPSIAGAVWCIEADGDDVYVGGDFNGVNGTVRRRLARLDRATGMLEDWHPTAGASFASDEGVRAIRVIADVVYAGGDFDATFGGQPRRNLAAFDSGDGAPLLFDPNPNNIVSTLDEHSTGLVVGGNFTVIGGQLRSRLAVVDLTFGVAQALDVPVSGGEILTAELDGDVLYCGGRFAGIGGVPRTRAAAIELKSGLVLPWQPAVSGTSSPQVLDIEVTADRVLLAGEFHDVSGQPRRHFAEVTKDTGTPTPLDVGAGADGNPRLWAVVRDGPTIAVGGEMEILDLVVRRGFAAFDLATEELLPLAPEFTDMNSGLAESVQSIAFTDDAMFVGGTFDDVDGQLHPRLAKIDLATGQLDPTFDLGFPFNAGLPGSLLFAGDTLVIGVSAITAGSNAGLSAWDADTGAFKWKIRTNSSVGDLIADPSGGKVYASGSFDEAEILPDVFVPRGHLLAVGLGSGILDSIWTPDASHSIGDLHWFDDHVYAAGGFLTIDGEQANYVAKLDAVTGALTPWPAAPAGGSVSRVYVNRDVAVLSGSFTHVGGEYHPKSAVLDTETATPIPWATEGIGLARFELIDGRLYVAGGAGTTFDGVLYSAPLIFDSFFPLTSDVDRLSVSAGGTQSLTLDVGPEFGGKAYWTLGSLSGSFPGTPITPEVDLPLNADGYFFCSLFDPITTPIVAPFGFLDAEGRATPSILLPPATTPAFVGVTLRHACAVFDPDSAEALRISNPTGLLLDP